MLPPTNILRPVLMCTHVYINLDSATSFTIHLVVLTNKWTQHKCAFRPPLRKAWQQLTSRFAALSRYLASFARQNATREPQGARSVVREKFVDLASLMPAVVRSQFFFQTAFVRITGNVTRRRGRAFSGNLQTPRRLTYTVFRRFRN